jgi:hypothetical protein
MTTESWDASGSPGAACRCARALMGSANRAMMTGSERSRDAVTEMHMACGMREGELDHSDI